MNLSTQTALANAQAHITQFRDIEGKISRKESNASILAALGFLNREKGLFEWAGRVDCKMGFNTIFEAGAAKYYAPGGKAFEQVEAAQQYASHLRNGIYELKDKLLGLRTNYRNLNPDITDEELDALYPNLFAVSADGSGLITCITIFRDHRPEGSTKTVVELEAEQAKTHAERGLQAKVRRLKGIPGTEEVRDRCLAALEIITTGALQTELF